MLVWCKLASAKWEDAWVERLRFLGPERLAISSLPQRTTIRIEAYGISSQDAAALVKQFGGQIRKLKTPASYEAKPRLPIRIRSRLVVVDSEVQRERAARKYPNRKILLIPAAMAFGTGEHATTAQCLRFLCDVERELRERPWDMLDLGTGTGVLAIAARLLGARRVEACDFDPHAVRTALENIRRNAISSVTVHKREVTNWNPPRQWDLVAANLYSEVLLGAAAKIAGAVSPGGRLFLSGILRAQESECIRAFRAQKLRLEQTARRGKWVTLAWRAMPAFA